MSIIVSKSLPSSGGVHYPLPAGPPERAHALVHEEGAGGGGRGRRTRQSSRTPVQVLLDQVEQVGEDGAAEGVKSAFERSKLTVQ